MKIDFVRETALKILHEIIENGMYSNIQLNKFLKEDNTFKEVDKGFLTELVYGVIKRKATIDYIIEKNSTIKLKKISPWILNILRLGIYQIIFMDRVPDSAACNESVILTKKYGHDKTSGFVNGVLRAVSRGKDNLVWPDVKLNSIKYLCVKYSFPEWMAEKWLKRYGILKTENLMNALNTKSKLTIRTNTLKTNNKDLIDALEKTGVKAINSNIVSEALIVENLNNIGNNELFNRGLFYIQDESSMLSVKVLDPIEGDFVIDVCSAPGGKATFCAQLMNNKGIINAFDLTEIKLKFIEENAKRLGINIISSKIMNATKFEKNLFEKADKVILDVPCSGLGIIRKKPDIKWARTEGDILELSKIQYQILENCSKYVKLGGILLYSTCTIEPEENIDVINKFLKNNDNFEMVDITSYLNGKFNCETAKCGYVQLLPDEHITDGFFICKMKKKK